MVFAALPTLQKNSLSTTTTSNMTTSSTEVEVTEQAVFYREGVLLTHGWELGPDNAVEFRTEEVIVTSTDGVSGAGTVFFSTRAVKADGTNGPAYAWPAGTRIRNTLSTSVYDQIKDNFAALPQSRNAIINGDCRVNQRVTAYTLIKDAYTWDASDLYGPDRHEGMATGTAVSAGTWGQTVTATAGNSGYAFTFSGVTLTGTGILYHRHRIEAKDAARFKNQTASFGCSVYQDTGGAINYTVYVRKANAADNFSAVTAISNSGAINIPSGAKTALKYEAISMGDCSNGIEIEIKIECGAVTTKNFEQTEIQFEIGSVATAFEFLTYSTELSRCLRYCWAKLGANDSAFLLYNSRSGTKYIVCGVPLPAIMRTVPTLFTSSPAWATTTPSGNEIAAYNQTAAAYITITGGLIIQINSPATPQSLSVVLVAATSFSGTSGDACAVFWGNTCKFVFSAEL